jgi:hypothetical protein
MDEDKQSLAESGRIMAEESRHKRVISEKALQLQKKEFKERVTAQAERMRKNHVERCK